MAILVVTISVWLPKDFDILAVLDIEILYTRTKAPGIHSRPVARGPGVLDGPRQEQALFNKGLIDLRSRTTGTSMTDPETIIFPLTV